MNAVVNFIANGVIFFIASVLFPNIIMFGDTWDLVIATTLFWFISTGIIITILLLSAKLILIYGEDYALAIVIACILTAWVACFFSLFFTESVLSGFTILGFWPKILMSICLAFFNTGIKPSYSTSR